MPHTDLDRGLLVLELGQLHGTRLDTQAVGDQSSELGMGASNKDLCLAHRGCCFFLSRGKGLRQTVECEYSVLGPCVTQ